MVSYKTRTHMSDAFGYMVCRLDPIDVFMEARLESEHGDRHCQP